jgi:hypothetical protein
MRAGAADPGLRPRADDGGEPPARLAPGARRPERPDHQADQRRLPHRLGHPVGHRPGPGHPPKARGGLRGGVAGWGDPGGAAFTALQNFLDPDRPEGYSDVQFAG